MKATNRTASVPIALIFLEIFLASSLLPVLSQAQDASIVAPSTAPVHRPRIGLALSGGGALGLAEIGVIQWMEENHIPVDRIAGTSMGSIIAAMYATGMSPRTCKSSPAKLIGTKPFFPSRFIPSSPIAANRIAASFDQCTPRSEAWPAWAERIQLRPGRGTVA